METIFVTGYPGFLAKHLVQHIVSVSPQSKLILLVESSSLQEAQARIARFGQQPIELVTGDVSNMHLGLAGREFQTIVDEATHIFHLAAVSSFNVSLENARKINVEGTRNVLELANECRKLERFVYVSSCYVSGDRQGVIAEDELDLGQSFRNVYERTKFEAEKLVRQHAAQIPTIIVRPSTIVGDSQTGEIDRFEGPYYLGMLLVLSPLVLPLPLPGDGVAPLNVVPVDFVARALWALAHHPDAARQTFHLVDPNPMSAKRVYQLIAERAHKRLPRFRISPRAADLILRMPGIERLTRTPRAAIAYVNHMALYSCRNTLDVLEDSAIKCPPLESYLDRLVDYALQIWQHKKESSVDSIEDPLDETVD